MSAISRNHARNFVLILCAGLVWMPGAVRPAVAQDLAGDDRDKSLSEYTKGVFLLESGSPEEALPYLEAAWRHSGHDARIGEKLADTYFRLGKLSSCGQVIDELLAANEKDPAALLLKAKIHYIKGERVDALQYLRTLKTVAKPSFDAERLFAKVLFELGRDEEALQAYGDAIALDPYYPFLHYTHGLLLQKFHKTDEAQKAMQRALRLEPRFTEAALELAAMMIEDQKFSKAEEVLETLLEEEIDSSEAVLMLANLYFDQGKLDKAIRRLEETAQGLNLTREGLLLLGRLYYEAKDYDEAFTVFENVFEKETRTPEMARVLGEISLKAGKHDQALKFYRVAIDPSERVLGATEIAPRGNIFHCYQRGPRGW